ncbi:MAG: DUF4924 family protein [Prevotellaceae bacterium]|nr:DUF4924 family protein [Prevotellaceae bacterium]
MYIAQKLRQENIAEYLIYMWQVEDLMRAFDLDIDRVSEAYLVRFGELTQEQRAELTQWYADIIQMMRGEKIMQSGHLQICRNVIINLADLHGRLMASHKFPYYHAAYHKALPLIVEFRSRQQTDSEHHELESCFELLYGVMLLKMQGREVSADTQRAVETISAFLGMLSDYYQKERADQLEL